jgi:GT2 family glycosyltransferase
MKNNIVVVFSSHLSKEENQKFIKQIDNTIGVKHKTVCYPNLNQYSLPQIYNQAIKDHTEKDSIFVMCHNDIIFKTNKWGKLLLTKFNSTDFDIIGVAGTTYLENGVWWEDKSKMQGIVEHSNGLREWVSQYSPEIFGVKEVVLIDGLFMSFDPDMIIHEFDETFNGFHFYDLSFCIPNYLDGCNIGVTTSIRVLHKSIGQTNQEWEINRQQLVGQYNDELPLTIPPEYKDLNPKLISEPRVSVIIPTKNNLKYLRNNIYSWQNCVNYDNYEIIIADTGSSEDIIKQYDEFLSDKIKLVRYDYYNFGKINNNVVRNHVSADTEIVLFCNDDILLLNDVLSRCVEVYNENKESVGTIGIRLHYGDASIQHNGITIIKDGNKIRLSHKDYSTNVNYNSKGNTGGFMLIRKDIFDAYDGFNENYIECLEDVELNLKCKHQGLKNITVSDAVAYHYESVSRNKLAGGDERFMVDFNKLNVFIKDNNIKI